MANFSRKVLRLLPEELTNTVLRDIDALFEDNNIPLGPPQPLDNDTSERRERTRRYLAAVDLANPSHALKLTGVYSDTLQRIARAPGRARVRARIPRSVGSRATRRRL